MNPQNPFAKPLADLASKLSKKDLARWEREGRPTSLAAARIARRPGEVLSRAGGVYLVDPDTHQVTRKHPKPRGKAARRAEKAQRRTDRVAMGRA